MSRVNQDRVEKIRAILCGFEVGDHVVIFRDTKSHLGQMIRHNPDGIPAVIVDVPDYRYVVGETRLLVATLGSSSLRGFGGRWYVHPDDMRLA